MLTHRGSALTNTRVGGTLNAMRKAANSDIQSADSVERWARDVQALSESRIFSYYSSWQSSCNGTHGVTMTSTSSRKHTWAVVLAGGDGTRLKEMTHQIAGDSRPKQFCRFFEGKSLLSDTRERIAPIFDEDRTLFALARAHAPFYRDQLAEVHDRRKVVQPANRGTAVAITLCLEVIAQQDEDAL
jgi:hypothetical protein